MYIYIYIYVHCIHVHVHVCLFPSSLPLVTLWMCSWCQGPLVETISLSLTSGLWPEGDWNSCWKPHRKKCSCMPVSTPTHTHTHTHTHIIMHERTVGWLNWYLPVGYLDNHLADISENLIYILWRHLQFYLVHCKPVGGSSDLGLVGAGVGKPSMRNLHG